MGGGPGERHGAQDRREYRAYLSGREATRLRGVHLSSLLLSDGQRVEIQRTARDGLRTPHPVGTGDHGLAVVDIGFESLEPIGARAEESVETQRPRAPTAQARASSAG